MTILKRLKESTKKKLLTITAMALIICTFTATNIVADATELTAGGQPTVESSETTVVSEAEFDAAFYASQYPDVVAAFGNDPQMLYLHYVNAGKAEGRFANATEAANAASAALVAQQAAEVPPTDVTAIDPNALNNGTYNILAIGNSITLHPVCSYWWGSWGMAASSADKDYVHQVQAGLQQSYANVNLDILSVQSWEASSARSRQLSKFDSKLANSYDLVIIQLGENVNNMSTFKRDFNNLVSYVKTAQPNAKVVIVGDYWYRSGRDAAKMDVAAKQGCAFADISSIRGDRSYRAARGDKVLGDDGKLHTVTNAAVIKHPNDAGMKFIADKILEAIQ